MKAIILILILSLLGPWNFSQVHASEMQETQETEGTEAESEGTVRNPVRQDALTHEQIDEGWQLIGGYAFPPEALAGDAGIVTGGTGSFSNETALSNVTIDLELPVGQTEPFVLYFTNADTLQEYYVTLYASNDYQDIFKIPAGAYYFSCGGPENDYMSLYQVVSPESFVVEPGVDLYLTPVVTSRSDTLISADEEESSQETEQASEPETTVDEAEDTREGTPWQVYLVIGLVLLAAAAGISIAALKYGKWKERH